MTSSKVKSLLLFFSLLATIGGTIGGVLYFSTPAETSKTIETTGTFASINLDVYWDITATDKVQSVDWGIVEPGGGSNVTFYIRNEGNTPLEGFLNLSNWRAWEELDNGTLVVSPENASDYLSVSWDFGSMSLNPNRVRKTMLVLEVSLAIHNINKFAFDITIIGRESE